MSYPRHYGPYVLLERLGAGGMSEVDLARRSVAAGSYHRFVVIKRVLTKNLADDGFLRMFKDEARINSRLHHQNIAQLYDFGVENGEFFLAMEYVPGMDLRQIQRHLARRGVMLPFKVTLSVVAGVLDALQYAHEARDERGQPLNVVHRDVNPRNVMVSISGEVKLIDFGVAKADGRIESTRGHSLKGKFAYMAPEQIEDGPGIDGRADLFACGLMLHELTEGVHPFACLKEVQIMHRILAGQIGPITRSPPHIDAARFALVMKRALETDRELRYPSALAFRKDLEELAKPLGGLCTRQQLSEFMDRVDHDGVSGISTRLQQYEAGELTPPPPVPDARPLDPEDGTLAREGTSTREVTVAAAKGVGVGVAAMLVLMGLIAAGAAGAIYWTQANAPPAPMAEPTEAVATPVVEPVAEPVTEPVAEPRPVIHKEPAVTPFVRDPDPVVVPTPRVQGDPEPVEDVVTEPPTEPVTEPVTESTDGPTAEPATEAAAEPGFLYVTASQKGLDVLVDGQLIGQVPVKFHALAPGDHQVSLRDPATGAIRAFPASIESGKPTKLLLTWE
ncbi:MAG: protein kinase [Proteobacteria bacterium]|nr:protein kinase [Pseudomonadota bacterium]